MTTDRIAAIREALEKASKTFKWYEELHRAKPDHEKADRNRDFALEMDKALTHLDALEKEREWQPIETAPRDGTQIIVYRVSLSGEGFQPEVGEDSYCAIGRCWMRCKGDLIPTHWMPLPNPPTIAGCKQQGDGDE